MFPFVMGALLGVTVTLLCVAVYLIRQDNAARRSPHTRRMDDSWESRVDDLYRRNR